MTSEILALDSQPSTLYQTMSVSVAVEDTSICKPWDLLKQQIANSARFRTEVGAADATEAKKKIHFFWAVDDQDFGQLDIADVNTGGAGSGSFVVSGDITNKLVVGEELQVKGSTGNNGFYTIRAGSLFAANQTTINVDEAVSDDTADGTIESTYRHPRCIIRGLEDDDYQRISFGEFQGGGPILVYFEFPIAAANLTRHQDAGVDFLNTIGEIRNQILANFSDGTDGPNMLGQLSSFRLNVHGEAVHDKNNNKFYWAAEFVVEWGGQ